MPDTARVAVTPAAGELLGTLTARHGPLMFHQSGGCCDGSSPMCYPVGMFRTGPGDVLLGALQVDGLDPVEVYMSVSQFEYWKYTRGDVAGRSLLVRPLKRRGSGRGRGFSLQIATTRWSPFELGCKRT
jgi:uncharacterized protein (DUF779 family)